MSFTLSEFMVTAVEDEDFTFEPYREEEVEVELPETMYGGYVDLAKGEIVQEYVCEEPNDRDWIIGTKYAYQGGHSKSVNTSSSSIKLMVCTHWINKKFDNIAICSININKYMVVCKNYFDAANVSMDNESIKAYFAELKANGTPFKICAPLYEPIHYQIPPETLKTLRGFNTIFSTGNDSIEVGYSELSPMSLLELRRNIIASEPHLVTVETGNTEDSDVIASFRTNAALPIKSMVTNFEPKQEGEGDPSPENIRPITGLKELKIRRCGRNFFDHNLTNPVNPVGFPNASIVVNEDRSLTVSSAASSSTQLLLRNFHGQTRVNANQNDMIKHIPNGVFKYRLGNSTSQFGLQFNYATNESRSDLTDETIPPGLVSIGISRGGAFVESEVTEEMKYNYFRLASYAGDAYSNVTIYPEIYLTSQSDGVYEPYVGDDYQIPLTLPNLITPEPKSITSYNVDFTVNEDGTVDYEGTPTSYAGVNVGYYHVKGGETITVTLCGDIANLCFNAQRLYDSNGNVIPFLGNVNNYEGRKTYTIDLSEYPDACSLVILLKRFLNDVYMKGKCWVRVVEGAADTGDEVFGGYVDLENNELVATYGQKKIFGNENWIISGAISGYCAYRPTIAGFASASSGYVKPICNKLKSVSQWATKLYEATINNNGNFYFGAPEELSTKEAVNEWVKEIGGIDVVYPLATPLHFPLSPTVIRTIKGTNNIYTNANGKSIIKYWTH